MKIISNNFNQNLYSTQKLKISPNFRSKNLIKFSEKSVPAIITTSMAALGVVNNPILPIVKTSADVKIQQSFIEKNGLNNDYDTDKFFKTFDFEKFGKKGIPLKYSRNDFLVNIKKLVNNLPIDEQKIILNHFGILITENGFEGLVTNPPFENKNVSQNAQIVVKNISKEAENFVFKNTIITGDKDADENLTKLIKTFPELITVIGKEQHVTHNYSVDIHTFKVLQSAMNHPLYEKLSDESKLVLKTSILLHDLGKKEKIVDDNHALLSTKYASKILENFPMKEETKSRITNIIKNHHWFASYNQDFTKAEDVVLLCNHPEDILIYIMCAKGDFENVNERFHLKRSNYSKNQEEFDAYMENKMKPLVDIYHLIS